jgi:hypothetical protein
MGLLCLGFFGSYDLPRMFLPRKSKCMIPRNLECFYLETKPDLPRMFYLEIIYLESKPDLPRMFLPRNYLSRKFLNINYLPGMFLPENYLPRK